MNVSTFALTRRRHRKLTALVAGVSLLSMLGAAAFAHEPKARPAGALTSPQATEPLYDDLGRLSWKVSTVGELAQKYFDQGLRWTYAFNHDAARRAFREAQRQDPDCAMCYWGEAFVLGPNINAPMEPGATNPAVAAIEQAKANGHHATPAERALIEALALRYAPGSPADRGKLDHAYADAMGKAYASFPDSENIAVLFADAIMNTSPWDYWQADGTTPKGRIGEAIRAVEGVLGRNPHHVGAIHLYIHLTEASATPQRAERYADQLAALMPGAGHIVHMGAHTFYRVGRFKDSADVNEKAVASDEAYFAKFDDQGYWRYGYHPHNIHFAAVSALMAGDDATALNYATKLNGKISDVLAGQAGWIQAIKQAPYFVHAHLSDPDAVLSLPDPGDRFPFVKAAWHYARGVASARRGRLEDARRAAARIAEMNQRGDIAYPADIASVAGDVLRLARHVVEGRIAQAEGDHGRAIREFEIAVRIQDSLAYLEPPFWYYPVRQSLGAALLQAGRPADAEAVFKTSLKLVPNDGRALFGLQEAQRIQGNDAAAKATHAEFLRAWSGRRPPGIDRL